MRWESASKSDVGSVREVNEDACLALSESQIWVIADGMGGYQAGDFASNTVVDTLKTYQPADSVSAAVTQLEKLLETANRIMLDQATQLNVDVVGSTIVVMITIQNCGLCVWAGDSRLYRLRDDKLEQISKDHSQVQELVSAGLLSQAQARNHPRSNIVTRALGIAEAIELEVIEFDIQPNDTFLLCSDGLTGALTDAVIAETISSEDCATAVNLLVSKSLAVG
ncbi:MAG: serine/threonine-protein phosphatase, partial [Gammaproteobacteria bacterium]|nr:serine/threonine-protein phosphatase [Gammaproteobacteria bacterium]